MKNLTVVVLVALLVSAGCSTQKSTVREGTSPAPKTGGTAFLGVSMTAAPDLKPVEGVSAKNGVRVHFVVPDSPADRAGIKGGDIIVAVGEGDFDAGAKEVLQQFRDRLAKYKPGDTANIKVVRREALYEIHEGDKKVENPGEVASDIEKYMQGKDLGTELSLRARNVRHVLVFEVTLCERPDAGTKKQATLEDREIHPELAKYTTALEKLADSLLEHYELTGNYEDLRKRLRGIEKTHEGFRLPEIVYLHRNPFHMERIASGIFESIDQCTTDIHLAAREQLRQGMKLLGVGLIPREFSELRTGLSLEEHLSQLETVLETANREREKAFEAFSEEDCKFIRENLKSLGAIFEKARYIDSNDDKEEFQRHLRLIKLAHKVKYEHLYLAARELLRVLSPQYLAGLRTDLAGLDIDLTAGVVAKKDTPFGRIIIGGTSDNWYRKDDAAVIIDLGGDDFYTNNSGASTKEIGCAIVVDLSGDDAYESTTDGAQGAGIFGTGILADLDGDDSYVGMRWCQGACAIGVGMLLDEEGEDSYRAHALAQGAALWGVAFCTDISGSDTYESHVLSQGVGMPFGVGILSDAGGDDRYYAKGTYPSGYGTPGIYEGWSQGCGVGFRKYASGGIGILVDSIGSDCYEAGNFSQGGGYYYGWGLLSDRGGEADTYIGSRYAQGFCAHQALGTFIEEGGDDTYKSRNSVHAGLAWDECVTLFVDRGGDDNYNCERGFSQGASAHNSICIFVDSGGKDTYASKSGPGRAGGNSYHGGTSLSLFVDLGGQQDSYASRAQNDSVSCHPEDALIVDLPSSDLSRLEDIKSLCRPKEEPKKKEERQKKE